MINVFRTLKLVVLILAAFLFANETVFAQENKCSLYIKTFSYNAAESKMNRIENVSVSLTRNGKTIETDAVSDSLTNVFDKIENGQHVLTVVRAGYIERKKQIEVDCKFVDNDNILWHQVYLWKDKSKLANDSALVEDKKNKMSKGGEKQPDKPKVFGSVSMQVWIDEDGNVVKAKPVSGKKELFDTATVAAMKSRFSPTLRSGSAVQVTGTITYNFVP